jgi:hypothetical protein
MEETIENQIYGVGFGKQEDEVLEKDFYKFISKGKLANYNNCMHRFYFKNETPLHGKYLAGFDDYKENLSLSKGLFFQLEKGKVFNYGGRGEKITKRDTVLTVIYVFKEYEMPYTKNIVATEEELDVEVAHFYFLNKYNLL